LPADQVDVDPEAPSPRNVARSDSMSTRTVDNAKVKEATRKLKPEKAQHLNHSAMSRCLECDNVDKAHMIAVDFLDTYIKLNLG